MELVAAQRAPGAPERAIMQEPRLAVAEMQPARGEARRMAEQPGHGVARAVGIDHGLAEHHVAAALAVHRARRGKVLRGPA